MGVETVSLIIAAFVNASLAIAALLRNFRSRLGVGFAVLASLLFAHDAVSVLESFDYSGAVANPRLHILITLLLGPAALFLLKEIIRGDRARLQKYIWIYVPLIAVASLLLYLPLYHRMARVFFILAHLFFIYPAVVWLTALWEGQGRAQLTRERLRLRYLFWGGTLVLAAFVTDALHFSEFPVPPLGTLARAAYLIFFFQTFIQKELMTAEEVVAKITLFGSVALMLSSIYLLLVSWVGDRPDLFFFNTFIASFGIIILFDPIRNLTMRFTRKLFLRSNALLEDELNGLSQDLRGIVEPTELARRISSSFRKGIGMEGFGLYLLERDGLSYVLVDFEKENRFLREVPASNPLVEYMNLRKAKPFVLETIESDRDSFHSAQPRRFCQSCLESLRKIGADFIIPLLHESRLVGFCAVSTGERLALSNEQLRLFTPVARQIALSLKNVQAFALLRDRDKLAVVGEMAAGLAHEIKNPLGAIKGAAQLLKTETSVGESPSGEFLKIILDETDRLSGVLTDFLDYAKPRRTYPQTSCDPLRVIEHTAALILQDSKINIEMVSERTGIRIEADPEGLKQVLLNLFLNAIQAMQGFTDSPNLKIEVREIRPKKLFPLAESLPLYKIWEGWQALTNSPSRAFLEISVKDNGVGIAAEDLSRIFVPFYTTKPKGTGLGLAVCQRLIEGMGGSIHVRANRPAGTVFTIHLPLKREEGKDFSEPQGPNIRETSLCSPMF